MADAEPAVLHPRNAGTPTSSPEEVSPSMQDRATAETASRAAPSVTLATTPSPPPPVAGSSTPVPFAPPPRSPPVTSARKSGSGRRNSPDHRRIPGSSASVSSSSTSSGSTDNGGACSPGRAQARARKTTRGLSEARQTRAGSVRSSRSNSPPQRLPGAGNSGLAFSYGGVVPGAVSAVTVAGVAGPGGGAVSGAYMGALGLGGWSGVGAGGGLPQYQQSVYPVALPPISPASATSSGKFVVGVSPASATSHRGGFSVASSVTSGSELQYSPSAGECSSTGRESHYSLQYQNRVRPGTRELHPPSLGSSAREFGRARAGSNSSSEGGNGPRGEGSDDRDGGNVGGRLGPCGVRDVSLGRARAGNNTGGSRGMNATAGEAVARCDYENSDHSGDGVDDGVSSNISRGSLLVGESALSMSSIMTRAAIVPASARAGRGGERCGEGGSVGGSVGSKRGEYKLGQDRGENSSMALDDPRRIVSEDLDNSLRSTDGLIGSSFLNSYGDHASEDGNELSERRGRARGRGRSGPRHPRIRPTHERGASPVSTPHNLPGAVSGEDSGMGGAEFLSSPGGTRLLETDRSPLSGTTASGSEMTEAAKLTSSVRYGSVGDIQANLKKAEKSLLVERDGEGASLLMHAAQRGETDVFRSVLDFLSSKLTPTEVLAEFCAQDEDGQTPLLFAARSGSGEVFRHALEALLARASPEKVLQELTAKERGDWTPLMAAAGSGTAECFQEVLRAIAERTSEDRVMNELMTKDSGGWTPLSFAFRSGNRGVFVVAMQAFLERGDEGARRLKEQLLTSQDESRSCLLEAAATAGWFSRGPQMPLSLIELIDSAWDDFERGLDNRRNITVDREAFEHAVRYQDLTGLTFLLSHGCGLSLTLIERLVEACGPRSVRDCILEAAASARNPLVPALGLLKTLSSSGASRPLHESWFAWMRAALEKLILQVLANLPVSARALNKRVAPAGVTSIFGRMNSDASGINSGGIGTGGTSGSSTGHRFRRPAAVGSLGGRGGPGAVPGRRDHGGSGGVGSSASASSDGVNKGRLGCPFASVLKARESLLVAEWVLEPESRAVGMRKPSFEGPVAAALGMSWAAFVSSPLVGDFLWAKFTAGIELDRLSGTAKTPDEWFSRKAPRKVADSTAAAAAEAAAAAAAAAAVAAAASSAASESHAEGEARQSLPPGCLRHMANGDWDITVAPRLRAILVGAVARPEVFYGMPAAGAVFDIFVYLCMLVIYVFTLYRTKPGPVSILEVVLYVWVLGMCLKQVKESTGAAKKIVLAARAGSGGGGGGTGAAGRRGARRRRRRWQGGMTATVLLAAALVCRLVGLIQDPEGHERTAQAGSSKEWTSFDVSLALLVASAPLLLLHLLVSAAAFSRSLGPTVQAMSLMAKEAAKVLPLLACILFGCALALHVLYGEGSSLLEGTEYVSPLTEAEEYVDGFRTFGASCGTVLGAGLGVIRPPLDMDVPYGEPYYIILYLFGVAVALGMASILAGVLANSEAADPVRMGQEFHLARARAIVRATEACRKKRLPAPLNIAQWMLGKLVSVALLLRSSSAKRRAVREACSFQGRLFFWILMGLPSVAVAMALDLVSLGYFWWVSWRRVLESPKDLPRVLLALLCTSLWCTFGAPVRLLCLWLMAARFVVRGDEEGRLSGEAVRRTVLKGRLGGDYDLARLLKRTRWGGGSSRSVSERGCSVADIVANIDDPLNRGSRFREALCCDDDTPSTLGQVKALAKRTQDTQTRTSDRLKSLEASVVATLARVDTMLERNGRAQQQHQHRPPDH